MLTLSTPNAWRPLLLSLLLLTCGCDGGGTEPELDAGSADAGSEADAGSTGPAPITAPNEVWTWIDFPDSRCANGEATGIGVNLTDRSDNLLIYLMGGGACWDDNTCYTLMTAVNIRDGFDAAKFATLAPSLSGSLFDRRDATNPTRDYSYVLVPYCTGDIFAGSHVADYGPGGATHHVGYDNMTAFLARIHATFSEAGRVILSGSSAGGYGASYNWGRAQDLFGSVRVDLIDDCGPMLPNPYLAEPLEAAWRASWGLESTLPADCAGCAEDLSALLAYDLGRHTDSRVALLAYSDDDVIRAYFGLSTPEYQAGLMTLDTEVLRPHDHARRFVVDATAHVMLGNPAAVSSGGVVLKSWLRQMIEDDPSWADVP